MRVRKATPRDAEAIVELHARTVRASNVTDYSPEQIEAWLRTRSVEKMEAQIHAGEIYVCVDNAENILGFGGRTGAYFSQLYVAPENQRRGIGSLILREVETDARADGLTELHVSSTLSASDFYRRHGYEEMSATRSGVRNITESRAVDLRKKLL